MHGFMQGNRCCVYRALLHNTCARATYVHDSIINAFDSNEYLEIVRYMLNIIQNVVLSPVTMSWTSVPFLCGEYTVCYWK